MNRVASYSVGLLLAIVLTLAAFSLAIAHSHGTLTSHIVIPAILALAMVQLVVQLIFFLHLGRAKDAQWNTALFGFTFFGILVIVLASVWIMYHLNYNMTPTQVNQYIINQSGF
jgi:cytochrome o ubiquinol oxidase operon protein cyoD